MGPPLAQWSAPRAKVQLKLTVQRLRVLQDKISSQLKASRREIAALAEAGKLEKARIKTEGCIVEDTRVELMEVLELYAEILLARFGMLEMANVDPTVQEQVAGIIHAAPRIELKEVGQLRDMLMHKFGRDFALRCVENTDGVVSPRITSKLNVATPPPQLVDLYLYEIVKAYGGSWRPEGMEDDPGPAPDAVAAGAEDGDEEESEKPDFTDEVVGGDEGEKKEKPAVPPPAAPKDAPAPPPPSAPAAAAAPKTSTGGAGGSSESAYDALARRFAALKKP